MRTYFKHVMHIIGLLIISVSSIVLFFGIAEIGTRVYFTVKYKNPFYLHYGFQRTETDQASPTIGSQHKEIQFYDRVKHIKIPLPKDRSYIKAVPGVYRQVYRTKTFDVKINNLGFKGDEFSQDKPEGVIRIFCVGASSTEGLEVGDGSDYPSILEGILTKENPDRKIEVINAGFAGASSGAILDLLRNELLNYQPDLIIFYQGFNNYHSALDGRGQIIKKFQFIPHVYSFLYSKSLLFAAFVEKKSIFLNRVHDKVLIDEILSRYEGDIQDIAEFTDKKDIKLILAKQAIHIDGYQMKHDPLQIQQIESRIETGEPISREDLYYYMHYRTGEVFEDMAKKTHAQVVDINSSLSEYPSESIFVDIVHLKKEGNEVIAQVLSEKINQMID